jgi:hypothetical protein
MRRKASDCEGIMKKQNDKTNVIKTGNEQRDKYFYCRDFHEFSCSSGSLQDFEIFLEMNGYFLFSTTT